MSNDTSATNCWLSRWKTDTRWWAAWQWEKTRPDQTGPDGTRRDQSNWNDSFNRLLISLVAAGSRCSLVSSSFCFGLALGSWRTWTTIVVGRSWLLLADFQWLSMIFNELNGNGTGGADYPTDGWTHRKHRERPFLVSRAAAVLPPADFKLPVVNSLKEDAWRSGRR